MSKLESSPGNIYRQGDVLLVPCEGFPPAAKPQQSLDGRVVLAEGERTGHAHTMPSDRVVLFREDGAGHGGYLRVEGARPVALSHEEHATIDVAPGTYRVVQQREYLPRSAPRIMSD